MNGLMDDCKNGCMDRWTDDCVDECIDGCMNLWFNRFTIIVCGIVRACINVYISQSVAPCGVCLHKQPIDGLWAGSLPLNNGPADQSTII